MMNRIKELRESRGWTQKRLAKETHCTDMTISRYESNDRGISSETICRLCDIFGCTADYLLGRSALAETGLAPEEEILLLAYRRADERARGLVDLALQPFKQDASSQPTSDIA